MTKFELQFSRVYTALKGELIKKPKLQNSRRTIPKFFPSRENEIFAKTAVFIHFISIKQKVKLKNFNKFGKILKIT